MTEFQFRYTAMMLWLIVSFVTESWMSLLSSVIAIGFSVAAIWAVWKEHNK